MRTITILFISVFLFFTWARSAAQSGTNNRILFGAIPQGALEVPPVLTNAIGLATVLVSPDRDSLYIHGVFTGLSGPITGCHLHNGVAGANGGVFLNLTPFISGNRLRADVPVPADFFVRALEAKLYLNVHAAANPGGEIRDQLTLLSDELYGATLSGLNEVPPVLGNAIGLAKFRRTVTNGGISYEIVANGLSGPITAAHIHEGIAGANGPVVTPLSFSGNTLVGELNLASLPSNFADKLTNGQYYVNIHTAANPGGEIRGQLRKLAPLALEAFLNGDQETPPVTTAALGVAFAELTSDLDSMTYSVQAQGLAPTAAHFHTGAAGAAGGVLVGLQASASPLHYTAKVPLTPAQVTAFLNSGVYVNVHTAAHPAGEIRGQMEPILRRVYAFDLCGEQEAPPVSSNGQGAGIVTTDRLNTVLSCFIAFDGLSGPVTACHIHEAAPGVSGSVVQNLGGPIFPGLIMGGFPTTGALAAKLESGNTYVNVHTSMHPTGEIRGQIRRGFSCSINTDVYDPLLIGALTLAPNPTSGYAELRMQAERSIIGKLLVINMVGQIVQTQTVNVPAGQHVLPLELGTLTPGLYIAQLVTPEGRVFALKVMKE